MDLVLVETWDLIQNGFAVDLIKNGFSWELIQSLFDGERNESDYKNSEVKL